MPKADNSKIYDLWPEEPTIAFGFTAEFEEFKRNDAIS
jgi:hypothetical protein